MSGSSGDKKSFKKYLPAVFLVLLTIALMFYFKENRGDFGEIVDKSADDLLALYTENLQPLLFGTDITNEDVFNFALYQTLPVDKKQNKVLKVTEENGNTSYQVIPATYKEDTENYGNFVKYMGFNKYQKTQLDSILESYQSELAEAVLTNDKNTLAVSPRLANLQKAILTDIAVYSREVDKPKLSKLLGGKDLAFLESSKAENLVREIKQDTTREYLIIADDTAFTSKLEINTKELEQRVSELNKKMAVANSEKTKIKVKAISDSKLITPPPPPKKSKQFFSDTGFTYSYTLPEVSNEFIGLDKKSFDSLKIVIGELKKELNNISFNIDIDSLQKSLKFDMQMLEEDSTLHNMNFEFNFENLGEIINKSIESATKGKQDEAYWEQFGMEMDSLAKEMVKYKEDSAKVSEEMMKKIEELKKNKNKAKRK